MSAFIYLGILAALVIAAPVLITRALAGKRDDEADTARVIAAFKELRAMPETTAFDPPVDLARARLVSVPLQRSLSLVAPVADDDWLEELITARPNPFTVPIQRRPGSAS